MSRTSEHPLRDEIADRALRATVPPRIAKRRSKAWFGFALGALAVFITLLLTVRGEQYDVEGGLVAFSWRRRAMTEAVTVRSEVWIALGIGVLYTLLGLVVDWPLSFQVDMVNNLLWVGHWKGGSAISLTWLWWPVSLPGGAAAMATRQGSSLQSDAPTRNMRSFSTTR